MLVVVAVRNLRTNFVQLGGPHQLAPVALVVFARQMGGGVLKLVEELGSDLANAVAMCRIGLEFGNQPLH